MAAGHPPRRPARSAPSRPPPSPPLVAAARESLPPHGRATGERTEWVGEGRSGERVRRAGEAAARGGQDARGGGVRARWGWGGEAAAPRRPTTSRLRAPPPGPSPQALPRRARSTAQLEARRAPARTRRAYGGGASLDGQKGSGQAARTRVGHAVALEAAPHPSPDPATMHTGRCFARGYGIASARTAALWGQRWRLRRERGPGRTFWRGHSRPHCPMSWGESAACGCRRGLSRQLSTRSRGHGSIQA